MRRINTIRGEGYVIGKDDKKARVNYEIGHYQKEQRVGTQVIPLLQSYEGWIEPVTQADITNLMEVFIDRDSLVLIMNDDGRLEIIITNATNPHTGAPMSVKGSGGIVYPEGQPKYS